MSGAGPHGGVAVSHPAEDQMLLDFLAAQRAIALDIVADLDESAWHRSVVPSGWTPAGLVEHLSGAQFHWFIGVVAGEDTSPPADADVTQVLLMQKRVEMPGCVAEGDASWTAYAVLAHVAHGMAHFAGHMVAKVTEKST